MNFSISASGTQITIHSTDHGAYNSFMDVSAEIIRREKTVVLNELIVEINNIKYIIPDGINKILNGATFDEILLEKAHLDHSQHNKEALKEKARQAFESSEAVKKLKEKEAATLLEKQKKEQEHKKNEETVWFYSKDADTREGPISFNELKSLHSNQTIDDDTLVWSPESNEWEKSKTILSKKQLVEPTTTLPQVEHKSITSGSSNDENLHKQNNTNNKASVENKHMKAGWLIFNVIAIVVISVLLKLVIISDGINPILILTKSSPDLILRIIADTAGIYVFSLFFGLFGFFYKPNRTLGFILVSWAGLLFMIYISFLK